MYVCKREKERGGGTLDTGGGTSERDATIPYRPDIVIDPAGRKVFVTFIVFPSHRRAKGDHEGPRRPFYSAKVSASIISTRFLRFLFSIPMSPFFSSSFPFSGLLFLYPPEFPLCPLSRLSLRGHFNTEKRLALHSKQKKKWDSVKKGRIY